MSTRSNYVPPTLNLFFSSLHLLPSFSSSYSSSHTYIHNKTRKKVSKKIKKIKLKTTKNHNHNNNFFHSKNITFIYLTTQIFNSQQPKSPNPQNHNHHHFFIIILKIHIALIYYSRYLSSKLYIGMCNMINCVMYYGTEGVHDKIDIIKLRRMLTNALRALVKYPKQEVLMKKLCNHYSITSKILYFQYKILFVDSLTNVLRALVSKTIKERRMLTIALGTLDKGDKNRNIIEKW